MKGGEKLKKFTIIGSVLLAVVLIVGFVVYAGGEDKPKAKSTDVAAQKAEKCDLEEGSAACQERHAKGECTGHELERLCRPGVSGLGRYIPGEVIGARWHCIVGFHLGNRLTVHLYKGAVQPISS